jgi:2-methylcitrate dehydratase PrpD
MLTAAVAGYELALRLGRAGMNHRSAFHPTAVSGTFAATAIAGKLIGLDDRQLASAFGIAGSQAAGSWKFLDDGSGIKRLHGGWPGHCGATAALLAQAGLTGPASIFDGPRGVLATYGSAGMDAAALVDRLGERWLTPDTTYKVYPCCSLCQAAMDAARHLQRQHAFEVQDIGSVECLVAPEAFRIVCQPREEKLAPLTAYQAAFSLPFCVAVALLDPAVSVASFSDSRLRDRDVIELARRVEGVPDPGLKVADGQPARVAIKLRDGRTLELAGTLRGTRDNPFTPEDIEIKFRDNARGILSSDRASENIDYLRHLDEIEDVRQLTRLLASSMASA